MQNLKKTSNSTRIGMMAATCAMFLAVGVNAQTTPDRGTMDSPPPASERTMDTPADENRNWQRFDKETGAELGLEQSQIDRLQDVDSRYEAELESVGAEPMSEEHESIVTRRNEEVREILTPEQYARWEAKQQAKGPKK